jgi:hypothetical protein
MDQATAKQMVSLLNALLAKEPDRKVLMARLDSIIETLKKSSAEGNKKFEDLVTHVDCSAATPEAMGVAMKARAVDRVISKWQCRPENLVTQEVQGPLVLMFSSQQFQASKAFLDQLVKGGLNILKEVKPAPGPRRNDPTETGLLLARYFYVPAYRPLIEGKVEALEWIIANAPPDYWKGYPTLMDDLTKIMRLPNASISTTTTVRIIALLRQAGVPTERNNYLAFREAYKKWLQTQLTKELRASLQPPTGEALTAYTREMSRLYPQHREQPGEADLWKAVSDALAPNSADALRAARSRTLTEITENDLQAATKAVEQLTDQLSHRAWWRKLTETTAIVEEAARRQAANVFDTYGYIQVAPGDVRDDDVVNNQFYPNCNCLTAKGLRDQLAEATQRKAALLEFRTTQLADAQ